MEINLEGPRDGEVLIRNVATGVCHTDAYTLSGSDPEGIFPSILGHEGGSVVEEIGSGVSSVSVGDHVIPLYTPECKKCKFCTSGKTNLCQSIRETQGQGLMPDGTSRFSSEGKTVRIKHRGRLRDTVENILGGVRSTCTYIGAKRLKDMPKCATFIRVTQQSNEIFGRNS